MVDSINNSGNTPNLNRVDLKAVGKSGEKKDAEKAGNSAPVDEVAISEEALSLAEAEATAKETRIILEQQLEETLSPEGGNRIDTLL